MKNIRSFESLRFSRLRETRYAALLSAALSVVALAGCTIDDKYGIDPIKVPKGSEDLGTTTISLGRDKTPARSFYVKDSLVNTVDCGGITGGNEISGPDDFHKVVTPSAGPNSKVDCGFIWADGSIGPDVVSKQVEIQYFDPAGQSTP